MRCVKLLVLLAIPCLLNAFSFDSRTTVYRTEDCVYRNPQSMAVADSIVYFITVRGLSIYEQTGDSFTFIDEILCGESQFTAVEVYRDKMYLGREGGSDDDSLRRYDISDPTSPQLEDTVYWADCNIFFISNGYLFVNENFNGDMRCKVLDYEDFYHGVAFINLEDYSLGLRRGGDGYAYTEVQTGAYCWHFYDISDPSHAEMEFTIVRDDNFYHLDNMTCFKDQDNLYLLCINSGAEYWDITDPDEPVLLWFGPYDGMLISFDRNRIAHVLGYESLIGLDLRTPSQPTVQYEKPMESLRGICWDCNRLFTVGASLATHEWSIDGFMTTAELPLTNFIYFTSLDDQFLNFLTGCELHRLDCSDLSQPLPENTLKPAEEAYSGQYVSCAGNRLVYNYVVEEENGYRWAAKVFKTDADGGMAEIAYFEELGRPFMILRSEREIFSIGDEVLIRGDLSDTGYEIIDVVNAPLGIVAWMGFYDDYVYLTDSRKMSVVHAPEDGAMTLTDTLSHPDMWGLNYPMFAFYQHFMFISSFYGDDDTYIYSLEDPAHPEYIGLIEAAGPMAVDEENALLFMGYETCVLYDLSAMIYNNEPPYPYTSFDAVVSFSGLHLIESGLLLAVDKCCVDVIEYTCDGVESQPSPPAAPSLALQCSPNPFNPQTTVRFALSQPGRARLEAFNIRGQRVAMLLDEYLPAGEHSAVWNAVDQASGVYFLRLRAGGESAVKKAVVLK